MGLYGLTVQKGPWKSTPYTRRQEQTSDKVWRGGGVAGGGTTHAGHGNWYSLMNPQSMSLETGHFDVPDPGPYAYPSVIVPARVTSKGVTVRAKNESLRNALKDLTRAIDKSGLRPNKYYGGGGPNGGSTGGGEGPPDGGIGPGNTIGGEPGNKFHPPFDEAAKLDQFKRDASGAMVDVKSEKTSPNEDRQILQAADTNSSFSGTQSSGHNTLPQHEYMTLQSANQVPTEWGVEGEQALNPSSVKSSSHRDSTDSEPLSTESSNYHLPIGSIINRGRSVTTQSSYSEGRQDQEEIDFGASILPRESVSLARRDASITASIRNTSSHSLRSNYIQTIGNVDEGQDVAYEASESAVSGRPSTGPNSSSSVKTYGDHSSAGSMGPLEDLDYNDLVAYYSELQINSIHTDNNELRGRVLNEIRRRKGKAPL